MQALPTCAYRHIDTDNCMFMQACMYLRMYGCIPIDIHMHTFMQGHTCICFHADIHKPTHAYMPSCMNAYMPYMPPSFVCLGRAGTFTVNMKEHMCGSRNYNSEAAGLIPRVSGKPTRRRQYLDLVFLTWTTHGCQVSNCCHRRCPGISSRDNHNGNVRNGHAHYYATSTSQSWVRQSPRSRIEFTTAVSWIQLMTIRRFAVNYEGA